MSFSWRPSAGSLSYSWRLILAPPYVLDYLAAHEVAHLVEMNHSPRFWAVVAGGIAVTFAALRPDLEWLPCVASAGIGMWLAFASWRMIRTQARDLLRSDARM